MASKPVIMVIGASGTIGVATLKALVNYADKFDIRAGVRDPQKAADKLSDLQGAITFVKVTMGDEDLSSSLRGVSRLFIVTPGVENRAELTMATAHSAKLADVKSIVVVSVLTADLTSTVFGGQFKQIETSIKKLGVACTFLRLPLFMENYFAARDSIVNQSCIYLPVDPAKPYTPMAVSDAGQVAAAILAEPAKHAGKTYNIVSSRHTLNEVSAEFSRQLDKQVQFIRVSYEDAKKSFMQSGFPEWQVNGILELYQLIDKGSYVTNQASLDDYRKVTGMAPTSLQDWVTSVINAFQ